MHRRTTKHRWVKTRHCFISSMFLSTETIAWKSAILCYVSSMYVDTNIIITVTSSLANHQKSTIPSNFIQANTKKTSKLIITGPTPSGFSIVLCICAICYIHEFVTTKHISKDLCSTFDALTFWIHWTKSAHRCLLFALGSKIYCRKAI